MDLEVEVEVGLLYEIMYESKLGNVIHTTFLDSF